MSTQTQIRFRVSLVCSPISIRMAGLVLCRIGRRVITIEQNFQRESAGVSELMAIDSLIANLRRIENNLILETFSELVQSLNALRASLQVYAPAVVSYSTHCIRTGSLTSSLTCNVNAVAYYRTVNIGRGGVVDWEIMFSTCLAYLFSLMFSYVLLSGWIFSLCCWTFQAHKVDLASMSQENRFNCYWSRGLKLWRWQSFLAVLHLIYSENCGH